MAKKATSRPGLFGSTNHCDERGRKTDESRPGFIESAVHYDASEKKVGESTPDFLTALVFASMRRTNNSIAGSFGFINHSA